MSCEKAFNGFEISLEKSPVRSGFDSSFDAVKISRFPSARNRSVWRKTSISRFLENGENADRLKLVEEREMKTPPAHAAASERPPTVGCGRHSSSRSCRLPRRALPRSLTRTSSRLSRRPRRRPLTLSPPGRRRARSTPRRSRPSSPPWRPSTGLTSPTLLRGTMQLPSTRRRRSRRSRPGSRPSPRSQRSAGR